MDENNPCKFTQLIVKTLPKVKFFVAHSFLNVAESESYVKPIKAAVFPISLIFFNFLVDNNDTRVNVTSVWKITI